MKIISKYSLSFLSQGNKKKNDGHKYNYMESGYCGLGVSGCYIESLMLEKYS